MDAITTSKGEGIDAHYYVSFDLILLNMFKFYAHVLTFFIIASFSCAKKHD